MAFNWWEAGVLIVIYMAISVWGIKYYYDELTEAQKNVKHKSKN